MLFVVLVFASAAAFAAGLYRLHEKETLRERFTRRASDATRKFLSRRTLDGGYRLARRFGFKVDLAAVDRTLFLAGRPFGLSAEEFVGANVFLAVLAVVCGAGVSMSGAVPPGVVVLLTASAAFLPWQLVKGEAARGRDRLRNQVVEFCSRLEVGASAGLVIQRVVEWAADDDTILGRLLKNALEEVRKGRPLYAVLSAIGADYGVPEMDEISLIVKHGEVQGVEVAGSLRELSRDFRLRKEMDLHIKAAKMKPAVTAVLVFCALVATASLVAAPSVLRTFQQGLLDF